MKKKMTIAKKQKYAIGKCWHKEEFVEEVKTFVCKFHLQMINISWNVRCTVDRKNHSFRQIGKTILSNQEKVLKFNYRNFKTSWRLLHPHDTKITTRSIFKYKCYRCFEEWTEMVKHIYVLKWTLHQIPNCKPSSVSHNPVSNLINDASIMQLIFS